MICQQPIAILKVIQNFYVRYFLVRRSFKEPINDGYGKLTVACLGSEDFYKTCYIYTNIF